MKKNIWMLAVVYIVVACALAGAMYQFQKFVRERLWNLAVEDIMEVTKQGTMTLRAQMDSAHDTLNNFAEVLEEVDDYSNINEILIHYNKLEDGVMLYLDDYTVMPYDMEPDSSFAGMAAGDTEGIMAPHVRSGSNGTANAADYADKVMDVYVSCKLADGRRGYLTKEFRIDDIIHFLRREMLDFTAFPVFFVSNLLLVQRKKYYFNRAMVSRNCSIVL